MFTFDTKSAYHHIEIFESHRTYLEFQWQYQGKPTYFVFNVLPFGLSIAPYILTKILKPVIGYWRSSGERICMFLDDDLRGNPSKEPASMDAMAVKGDLAKVGFVLSIDRCVWKPSLIQTWLGHVFNMSENCSYVTETKLYKMKESISSILASPNTVTTRRTAEVTGRVMSKSKAIGSSVYFYSRHIFVAIETRASWDSIIFCSPKVKEELHFCTTI